MLRIPPVLSNPAFTIEVLTLTVRLIITGVDCETVPSIIPNAPPLPMGTPVFPGAGTNPCEVIIGAAGLALVLGFLAVILGTLNVVGGFVVTDRMLEMFKKKK